MARRVLGTGVDVFPWSPADPLHRQRPTEEQVRDALGRLTAELRDMAQRQLVTGWEPDDEVGFSLIPGPDGLILRGSMTITRAD